MYSAVKSCGLFNSGPSWWHMANTKSVTIFRVPDIPHIFCEMNLLVDLDCKGMWASAACSFSSTDLTPTALSLAARASSYIFLSTRAAIWQSSSKKWKMKKCWVWMQRFCCKVNPSLWRNLRNSKWNNSFPEKYVTI